MRSVRISRHYVRSELLLLALIEVLIFIFVFYASFHLRWWLAGQTGPNASIADLLPQAVFVASVMLLSMAAMGLYEASLRDGIRGSLIRIVVALVLGSVGLGFMSYLVPDLFLGRGILGLMGLISFIAITVIRVSYYYYDPAIFKRRILIIGASNRANTVLERTGRDSEIVGFVRVAGEPDVVDEKMIIQYDHPLGELVTEMQIDEIVVALNDRRNKLSVDELLDCKMKGVDIIDLLTYFEREDGIVRLDMLTPSWLVYSDGFHQGGVSAFLKRWLDIASSLILFLFTWPLMLITAICIAAENGFKGPLIYRQVRVGEAGKTFEVLKFRSMRTDAESDGKAKWATDNDTRITRVGRFIRKSRIDELPQIFNILRGDMSLVGPRPERPEFVVILAKKIEYYAERHRVKPGLTGWAQLSYPYGSSEEDALRKLEYDLYYTKNQSLFLDLLILLETVEVVLFRKGAI